jgi:hypothetical protein
LPPGGEPALSSGLRHLREAELPAHDEAGTEPLWHLVDSRTPLSDGKTATWANLTRPVTIADFDAVAEIDREFPCGRGTFAPTTATGGFSLCRC